MLCQNKKPKLWWTFYVWHSFRWTLAKSCLVCGFYNMVMSGAGLLCPLYFYCRCWETKKIHPGSQEEKEEGFKTVISQSGSLGCTRGVTVEGSRSLWTDTVWTLGWRARVRHTAEDGQGNEKQQDFNRNPAVIKSGFSFFLLVFCKMTTSSGTEILWILCVFVFVAVGGKNILFYVLFRSVCTLIDGVNSIVYCVKL